MRVASPSPTRLPKNATPVPRLRLRVCTHQHPHRLHVPAHVQRRRPSSGVAGARSSVSTPLPHHSSCTLCAERGMRTVAGGGNQADVRVARRQNARAGGPAPARVRVRVSRCRPLRRRFSRRLTPQPLPAIIHRFASAHTQRCKQSSRAHVARSLPLRELLRELLPELPKRGSALSASSRHAAVRFFATELSLTRCRVPRHAAPAQRQARAGTHPRPRRGCVHPVAHPVGPALSEQRCGAQPARSAGGRHRGARTRETRETKRETER